MLCDNQKYSQGGQRWDSGRGKKALNKKPCCAIRPGEGNSHQAKITCCSARGNTWGAQEEQKDPASLCNLGIPGGVVNVQPTGTH